MCTRGPRQSGGQILSMYEAHRPGITDRIEVGGCSIGRQLYRKGGSGTSDKDMCEFFVVVLF